MSDKRKRIVIISAVAAGIILVLAVAVYAGAFLSGKKPDVGRIENFTDEGDNKFTCTFDGIGHDLIIDLPEKTEGAPFVIMLHGYGNTAESFRSAVHLEKEANARGYAVIYVTGAPDQDDATSAPGWNSGIKEGGNRDVEFLRALAAFLQDKYSFDKKRTYAAGFSNGAFMIHRLAAQGGDTFTAVASVAGFMTEYVWDNKSGSNDIGFFQITGQKDNVVPKNSDGSAKHNSAPAIEDVMAYWAGSNGLDTKAEEKIGKKDSTLTKYYGDSKKQVWDLFVIDGRHSWPDEKLTGIDTNKLILDFFDECK